MNIERFTKDYAAGMLGFGIPDGIGLAVAIAEGDKDEAIYYSQVIGANHLTWYAAWKAVKKYDMLRHGAKNLKGLNFHKAMSGVRFLSSQAVGGPIVIGAAASMIAQRELYQMVDAEMQGAISYSRAGTMAPSRGPVITKPYSKRDMRRTLKNLGFD